MKIKPTPEQIQVARYAGALGHTHFAMSRSKEGKLQICSESCGLADALHTYPGESKPECVIARIAGKLWRVA